MKKVIIALLVLILASPSIFASTFQVGATGRFGGDITDIESYKDISNYDFGADARFNLGALGLAANILFGKNGENNVYNTIITANYRMEVSIVEFSFGAGYALPIIVSPDGDVLIESKPVEETLDVLKNSQLLLRAQVGVNLGGIGLSADYKIPLSTIVDYLKAENRENLESFRQGRVAISVLLNIL